MDIFNISESVLYGFQLVRVQLHLFYLIRIEVNIAQSDVMAGGHLKFTGRRFVVRDRN